MKSVDRSSLYASSPYGGFIGPLCSTYSVRCYRCPRGEVRRPQTRMSALERLLQKRREVGQKVAVYVYNGKLEVLSVLLHVTCKILIFVVLSQLSEKGVLH